MIAEAIKVGLYKIYTRQVYGIFLRVICSISGISRMILFGVSITMGRVLLECRPLGLRVITF